ncbi:fumarylacetoacetate hydrolase family protein [Nocardia sp. NPDC047648]|uniref:fumarylacetoacetate hydrolase family protein n=1 Tax=Nocardia sp. NPDC047648 TaxID=3155625 RepID=UPI0033CF7DA5
MDQHILFTVNKEIRLLDRSNPLRLYNTDQGPAREDRPGVLTILDLPDLGDLIRTGRLDDIDAAPVRAHVPLEAAVVCAPVPRPGKILIVGLNYASHAQEAREMLAALGKGSMELPSEPNFQVIAASAVTGPGTSIQLPRVAPDQVDYEGEVAVVIGRTCTDLGAENAWAHVAGLTIANDVSARDIQLRAMTGDPVASIGLSKSFDTFKPLGPCLVTADEFEDPFDLRIRTMVNGEVRQDDRTSSFLHSIPELISHLSRYQSLHAGDVICTGTPRGAGVFSNRYLRDGDIVEIEVEGIGTLINQVAAP